MNIALYLRVSTQRQVQAHSPDQQLQRLQEYLQQQQWSVPPQNIFRDDGYSGSSLKRPGLDRLRQEAASHTFDLILLTAPDRLARNYVHQVLLLEELQQTGCRVEFLDRPMNADPHDQLLLQIRGAVAEYERSLIVERTRKDRMQKLQAGLILPWTRPPYGYLTDPQHPRDPTGVRLDPDRAALVQELFALYLEEGATLYRLVAHLRDLGVPSPNSNPLWGIATLRGILTNPAYTGEVYAHRMRYRPPRIRRSATHPIGQPHDSGVPTPPAEWVLVTRIPALVTPEQFAQVQAKLAHNQSFALRNNKTHRYLLRALVSCGHCQLAATSRATPGPLKYYVCSGKAHAIHRTRAEHCPSRFVPVAQLDELVWADLCALLQEPAHITTALARAHSGAWLPQELQARRATLQRGHTSLGQQLERLTEAYLHHIMPLPEYQRRRLEVEQRQQALARQEQQLAEQARQHTRVTGLATSLEEFCQRVATGLAQATFEQQRQLVELLIDRVIVKDEEVEIRYVFPTSPVSEKIRFCHLRSDYFNTPHLIPPAYR